MSDTDLQIQTLLKIHICFSETLGRKFLWKPPYLLAIRLITAESSPWHAENSQYLARNKGESLYEYFLFLSLFDHQTYILQKWSEIRSPHMARVYSLHTRNEGLIDKEIGKR